MGSTVYCVGSHEDEMGGPAPHFYAVKSIFPSCLLLAEFSLSGRLLGLQQPLLTASTAVSAVI